MKKYLLCVFSLFVIAAFANTQELAKANKSFEDKLFKQAIEEFAPLLTSKNADARYQAQLKTVLSYRYLYQYDNALKVIYSYPVPKDNLWKARYYILKEQALSNIRTYSSPDIKESEIDPTKFTFNQLIDAKKEIYTDLWEMRKQLINMPSVESLPYLERHYSSPSRLVMAPTLYDFMISKWLDNQTKPQAEIYEESYKLGGADRQAIAEIWHIERILMFTKDTTKDKKANLRIANWMEYVSGMSADYNGHDTVKPYIFKANEVMAKAKAALAAATIYSQAEEYQKAVDATNYCLKLPLNYFSDDCKEVRTAITANKLELDGAIPFNTQAGQAAKIKIKTANTEKFYLNIYALTPEDFATEGHPATNPLARKTGKKADISTEWSQSVSWKKQQEILKSQPKRTLGLSVTYPQKYVPITSEIEIPYIADGLYAVTLSENKTPTNKDSLFFLNYTDIAAFATAFAVTNNLMTMPYSSSFFNVYTLNPKTGALKPNIKVFAKGKSLKTGPNSQLKIPAKKDGESLSLLAQNFGNYAILSNIWFNKNKEQKYRIILNTDRSIYRPGQEVKLQATVIEYNAPNYTAYSGKNKLEIKLKNANYQTIDSKYLNLDSMGSGSYTFTLPKETMLGNFNIEAKILSSNGYANIRVEEYKRPEFEVNLKQKDGVFTYNKPLTVEGDASYYYGGDVEGAKVQYSISKVYFTPWFCWWWPAVTESREDRIEGTTKTSKDGTFKITFIPKENTDSDPMLRAYPARYEVEVFVTDAGGRTISTQRTYTVSGQEKFFSMKIDKGFFRQNVEGKVNVKMVNANEAPLSGEAKAYIYSAVMPENDTLALNNPDIKEGTLITSYDVSFKEDGPTSVTIPPLEEGYYVLKLTAKDSKGKDNDGKLAFMVVNLDNPQLKLQQVTIPENKTYYPGETAIVLIGASEAKGNKYIEIYKNQYFVEQRTVKSPGLAVLEIPVKQTYRGGISLNWFSLYDYKAYQGSTEIEIPFENTDLTLKVNGQKDVLPGANVKLNIEAKDKNGKPINGQAIVTVYDKSLDYYAPHELNMPNPYSAVSFENNPLSSSFNQGYGYKGAFRDPLSMSFAPRAAMMKSAPMANKMMADTAVKESATAGAGSTAAQPQIRENFAETAFWAPQLKIEDGLAFFNFIVPERLTEWAVLAAAFTKDIKTGKTSFNFTTKKDLMIRMETPRFLREGDKLELRTIIANNSDSNLPITVELITQLDGIDAAGLLGLKQNVKEISLAPGRQTYLTWPVTAPQGTGVFTFTAVARAGGLSDGEVKTFPLLPSRQRLTQSATVAVTDGVNSLSIKNLLADKSVELDAAHLTIDPSIIMPVLNAMPMLTANTYETATSLINSYLPLAILNNLYKTYPELKEAASKLPKRSSKTPAWEVNDKMLLKELGQSPWYNLSKGYALDSKTINLFDAALVAKLQKETIEKLKKYQNEDGGFTWIQGGKSSTYITMALLENMGTAYSYGITIPQDMVKKAITYLTANITINLVTPSYENLTESMYMAYVLTSFPKEWYNYDIGKLMKTSEGFSNYMLPLGKAYAATIYARLGNKDKAELFIARLFDGAKSSPTTGIYWAPEERSWQWFNDTLNLNTAAIAAVTTVNPKDERLKGLVKWLMFSKKATMWGNSESAAKAVYTLMNVMDKSHALSQIKIYNISWAGKQTKVEVEPFDLLTQKLTYSEYAPEAKSDSLSAVITKSLDRGESSFDDFASLTALYTSATPQKASPNGLMNINKAFYLIKDKEAKALKNGATIAVGDEIQVRLTISCQNQFSFVFVSDPKPSAFETDNLLSGWQYDQIGRYEDLQDNATNFFIDWLPNGTYELKYTIRPTTAGMYNVGAAVMQSMFAPEFSGHSAGFTIKVK